MAALRLHETLPVQIRPGLSWALHSVAGTRAIEHLLLAQLPQHSLMTRAGQSAARLAMALAPHARHYWVVCGPGNNGGDGLIAAAFLSRAGRRVTVTRAGPAPQADSEAGHALVFARSAGVVVNQLSADQTAPEPPDLTAQDLTIDALLGIGGRPFAADARALEQPIAVLAQQLLALPCTVLSLDIPSGLNADTGAASLQWLQRDGASAPMGARHTLSLLTLKPGLFMAQGRDFSGQVWLDELGTGGHIHSPIDAQDKQPTFPVARLNGQPIQRALSHVTHKGLRGDVSVLGGQSMAIDGRGMEGAAWLAATAALHAGAGRVMVALLGQQGQEQPSQGSSPELMLRSPKALDLTRGVLVAGCGGGSAIGGWLPQVLRQSPQLVLDADALNAIAQDHQLVDMLKQRQSQRWLTVITPHPLEAARLLRCTSNEVQAHRIQTVQRLVDQLGCVVVLKGSGTVIGAPDETPRINPTGNGLLATGGTGDVLAGWIAAWMAQGLSAWESALGACWHHGEVADGWCGSAGAGTPGVPVGDPPLKNTTAITLTALQLAQAARPPWRC